MTSGEDERVFNWSNICSTDVSDVERPNETLLLYRDDGAAIEEAEAAGNVVCDDDNDPPSGL